jgi:integrase
VEPPTNSEHVRATLRGIRRTVGAAPARRLGTERLTDQSVCNLVKAYAERFGLKAADFGAHSLRAGFLTSAARRGASVFKMRDVSRHKSMDVLQAYVRDADLFRDHAGAGLL